MGHSPTVRTDYDDVPSSRSRDKAKRASPLTLITLTSDIAMSSLLFLCGHRPRSSLDLQFEILRKDGINCRHWTRELDRLVHFRRSRREVSIAPVGGMIKESC